MKENEASATAYTVAQGLLFTAGRKQTASLVEPETVAICERILGASPEGERRLRQLKSPVFRLVAPLMERLLMPGVTRHYALRKGFIEAKTRLCLQEGVKQVIGLGAGFDPLAWRLHANHPEVTFIEIDHPATSAEKRRCLMGERSPPANLHFLAVDLSQHSLEETLSGFPAFQPERPTLFICEGVLMYLEERAGAGLFAALNRLTGPGTRFLFTAVEPNDSPRNNTGLLLRLFLRIKGEPLAWRLPAPEMAAFVERQGYRLLAQADDETLLAERLPDQRPGVAHRGEYLAFAETP